MCTICVCVCVCMVCQHVFILRHWSQIKIQKSSYVLFPSPNAFHHVSLPQIIKTAPLTLISNFPYPLRLQSAHLFLGFIQFSLHFLPIPIFSPLTPHSCRSSSPSPLSQLKAPCQIGLSFSIRPRDSFNKHSRVSHCKTDC